MLEHLSTEDEVKDLFRERATRNLSYKEEPEICLSVWELKVQGLTYKEIGVELDLTMRQVQGAYRWWSNNGYHDIDNLETSKVALRQMDLDRLQLFVRIGLERGTKGDGNAAMLKLALDAQNQIAKRVGLNASTKIDLGGQEDKELKVIVEGVDVDKLT